MNLSKCPPSYFGIKIFPWFEFAPHLQEVENIVLNLFENNEVNHLLLQLPIRFGKTFYIQTLLTFALLMHNPDEQILIASHSGSFSAESVARVRDLIHAYGKEINKVEIDPAWASKDFFRIKDHKGECRAVSVGSKFPGATATTILADDLYGDQSEANSPTIRKNIELWWHGTLMGRKTPNSIHPPKVILIGTPRHPEDLQQQLEAANPDLPESEKWHVHRLPALSPTNEPLWDHFPYDKLMKIKAQFESMGQGHLFDTLYMCNPKLNPEGGWPDAYLSNLFYDKLPDIRNPLKVMACDPNMGARSGRGDFGCIIAAIYDQDNGDIFVEDCYLSRATYDKLEDAAVDMLLAFQPKGFLVETNVAFKVVADNIQRKAKQRGMFYPPIYHKSSQENKLDRIDALLSPLLNQKKIHLRDISACRQGKMQMAGYPSSENDDFPDCLFLITQMIQELNDGES